MFFCIVRLSLKDKSDNGLHDSNIKYTSDMFPFYSIFKTTQSNLRHLLFGQKYILWYVSVTMLL